MRRTRTLPVAIAAFVARALGHGARGVFCAGAFVASTALGVSLHANLPATRRLAEDVTRRALDGLFAGELHVEEVRSLTLRPRARVAVGHAFVLDPTGARAIDAYGVEADIDLGRLIASIVAHRPPSVRVRDVTADYVEIALDRDASGALGIVRAFAPRPGPSPAASAAQGTPPPPAGEPDESVRLAIGRVRVRHAWVHGNVVPPALDGDVDELDGRVGIEEDVLRVELARGRVTLRAPRAPGQAHAVVADAKGSLDVPFDTAAIALEADVTGTLGELPFTGHASIAGDEVHAALDVPESAPEAVLRAFPNARLTQPVAVSAKVDGKLPALAIEARARAGASSLEAKGELDLREGHAFHVALAADHVDAALVAGGPSSDLSARLHAEGNLSDPPRATFRLTTEKGVVAAQAVPPITAEGRLEDGVLTSTFRANEPGADASGKVVLDLAKQDLSFDVQARSDDLGKLARTRGVATGSASVRVTGHVDTAAGTVRGQAIANADSLESGPMSAKDVTASVGFSGPLAAPSLLIAARGHDVALRAGDRDPLVYPEATVRGRMFLVPTPRLEGLEVEVADPHGAGPLVAKVDAIELAPGGPKVRGASVGGLGAPIEASVELDGPRFRVRAKGDGLSVERAASLTGIAELRQLPEDARASVDIDLVSDGAGARGHADVALTSERGLDAEAHATFAGRSVRGSAQVRAAGLGTIALDAAELDLDGPPSAKAFERATGTAEVRGELDLAHLVGWLPVEAIEQLAGTATLAGRVERHARAGLPSFRATVRTRGLRASMASEAEDAPPNELAGVDAAVDVAFDGTSDEAEVGLLTWDRRGVLASVNAKSRLPVAALMTNATNVVDLLRHAPLAVTVDAPTRPLASWPSLVARPELGGRASARVELEGSVAAPRVTFFAQGRGLRNRETEERLGYEPIDGVVQGTWDGEHLVAVVSADERDPDRDRTRPARSTDARRRRARRAAIANAARSSAGVDHASDRSSAASGRVRGMLLGQVRMSDFAAYAAGGAPAWSASGELDVQNLELSPLPLPMRVEGSFTGRIKIRDLGGAPSLEARADVEGFAFEGARMSAMKLAVGARDGTLFASAHSSDETQGRFDVTVASRAFRWKGLEVGWDAKDATRIDYTVSGLRLAMLRSFAGDAISDLDGRLDGRGSAMFDASSQVFEGGIALSDGRLYVRSLGEDVTDVNALAVFEKSGVFRINSATGRVGEGEFRASAAGRMKGLRFVGANAAVLVTSSRGIPLSSQGVTFAEATGAVNIAAEMTPDRETLALTLMIPRAEFDLPQRDAQELEPLTPDEHIEVGVRRRDGRLAPVTLGERRGTKDTAEDALKMRVDVNLGDEVTLSGKGLNVQLTGRTLVDVTNEIAVTGRIDLRGGSIEAHGRRFVVDRGSVLFNGENEPGNPIIVAAAYWDAPDRTRIWVEFLGPLKTGTLTLRSEPAYSKNEILSILLFGRPDPNMATPGSRTSDASRATAVGTGFVATDLNRALSAIDENLQVETDTLSGNRTRTKVGYRVARNLRVQVGYAPGRSYREPDTTFAFLDWQFLPKWSVLATQGNRGTSILDVLFQHRY